MELVDSGSLKDVLSVRGRLPWREVAECAIQVCNALAYAHDEGVVHRDLKPANLFLSADGHVKVGDFGLARDFNRSRLTLEGQTVGSCRYMPPEQITGDAELTGASDLYALGCIMYQALVGRPPFDGVGVIEIFEAHLYSDPQPLAELAPSCPRALADLVMRLLAKDAAARPADAAAVRTVLARILTGDEATYVGAHPQKSSAATTSAAADPVASSLTARLYVPSSVAKPRWKTPLMVAAGLIAAMFAIGILWTLWR
jgi:serine/threonine protein kinase